MSFVNQIRLLIQNIFSGFKNKGKSHIIFLNVPYNQKDNAKKLGAKWDVLNKSWFITSNMNVKHFKQWLPSTIENLKAEYFYLAETMTNCFKCSRVMNVAAIVLPENFASINDIDENNKQGYDFINNDYSSIVSYVAYISPLALTEINKRVDNYSLRYSKTINSSYFTSFCKFCGVIRGDNYIIEEHDSPFSPVSVSNFKTISFEKILVPISLDANSWSVSYPPLDYYLGDKAADGMVYMRNCR